MKKKKYLNGGQILQGISPFLNFIPGAGPVLSAAAGGIGSMLNAHSNSQQQNQIPSIPTPFKMAYGGPIELEGKEVLVRKNKQKINVKGPKHEQGGVGYTPMTNDEYVFSDRLSGRFNKSFAKMVNSLDPEDQISENTLDAFKMQNEIARGNVPSKRKMQYGGPISNVLNAANPFNTNVFDNFGGLADNLFDSYKTNKFTSTAKNSAIFPNTDNIKNPWNTADAVWNKALENQATARAVGIGNYNINPLPTNASMAPKSNVRTMPGPNVSLDNKGNIASVNLNRNLNPTLPGNYNMQNPNFVMQNPALGATSNFSAPTINSSLPVPNAPAVPTNPVVGGNNSPDYNKTAMILKGLGLGYNAVMGALPADKEPLNTNPYAGRVKQLMSERQIDMQPILNRINQEKSAAYDTAGRSRSNALANALKQNIYSNTIDSLSRTYLQGDQMNNQYRAEEAQTLNSLGHQDVQSRTLQQDLNQRNRGAKQAFQAAFAGQLSQVGSQFNKMDYQEKYLTDMTNLMQNLYANFGGKRDKNGNITMTFTR